MTKNDKLQFKLLLVLMKHFLTTLDPIIFFILPVQRMNKVNVHAFSIAEGQCHPLCSSNQAINIAQNCY